MYSTQDSLLVTIKQAEIGIAKGFTGESFKIRLKYKNKYVSDVMLIMFGRLQFSKYEHANKILWHVNGLGSE